MSFISCNILTYVEMHTHTHTHTHTQMSIYNFSSYLVLKHCATKRKVAGSIPGGVIEIFVDVILPATLWSWG